MADLNIRNIPEETRDEFNVLVAKHAENQRELLELLIRYAEMDEARFEREVVETDRNRNYTP